uniref:Uncharacterized protein n=1 Tax=Anguilla anguilla TaxID=7936 RepID=A0A0E9V6Z9_ANGAN
MQNLPGMTCYSVGFHAFQHNHVEDLCGSKCPAVNILLFEL